MRNVGWRVGKEKDQEESTEIAGPKVKPLKTGRFSWRGR
jgi:hypothetical protein